MTLQQKTQFYESLKNTNYWLIVPVAIMAILSHISRAVRWKILIEPMGYKPSTSNTFYTVMVGYLANTFLPRVGEILKCSLLSRYEKIPMNKLIGTILIERVFDFVCYLVLIIITILIQINYVSDFVKDKFGQIAGNNKGLPIWVKLLIAALVILILIVILRWLFKRFAHHRYIISIK